ncbi:MAG: hypothetical protein NT167_21595, partial [Verrucomicrobia bacterium]|nr:hypothetical protein [Verrucomicrobiota bacterium]
VTGDTNLPANLPPTVSVMPDQTTLESEPVLMAILVTDPETATENLTIELTHTNTVLLPPENLTMNRVGNVIYLGLTPKPRRHGVDWFTLRVSDGVSIITRQFSWTVEDVAGRLPQRRRLLRAPGHDRFGRRHHDRGVGISQDPCQRCRHS